MASDGSWGALDTSPCAYTTAPADDGVQDAGVVLDLGVLEDDGLLDTGTGTDDGTGSNGDVGTELGGWVDGGCGVDEDRREDVGGWRSELFRLCLEGLLEVKSIGWHSGAGRLDLSPEVPRLVNKEAVAVSEIGEDVLL